MSQLGRRKLQDTIASHEAVHPFVSLARIQAHATGTDIGTHEIVV